MQWLGREAVPRHQRLHEHPTVAMRDAGERRSTRGHHQPFWRLHSRL